MCTSLTTLKRTCKREQGGIKKLYLIRARDLSRDIATWERLKTHGYADAIIPLLPGKGIVEIEASYDSTKIGSGMKTGAGFSHNIEFKHKGYEANVIRLEAILNQTAVCALAQDMNGNYYWLGSKSTPLFFEVTSSIPEKGLKEVTFTAQTEGSLLPVVPLEGELAVEWITAWTFAEYLELVNREFDTSFEMVFA